MRYPSTRLPRVPIDALTAADLDATWSANSDVWEAGYDEHGDVNRKYISDPVLFRFLGDVRGRRELPAYYLRSAERVPFSYVLKFVKTM